MDQNSQNDEISIKELILTIQDYWRELLRNWWKIALITIPFLAFFIYKTYNTKPTYNAEIKFFVEGEGGGSGALGGILGSFGIKTGGGKNNPYQILEVMKNNILLEEVLSSKAQNSEELISNLILVKYDLINQWSKKFPSIAGYTFPTDTVLKKQENYGLSLNLLIDIVENNEKGKALREVKYDEDNGYYIIRSKSIDQSISYNLVYRTYEEIKNFYNTKTLEGYKNTRDILKSKVDSLDMVIKSKMYQYNRFGDINQGLLNREKGTQREILQREVSGLSLALGEAIKTYEMAEFNLRNNKNQFLIIKKPILPIIPEEESLVVNLFLGILFGGLSGCFFIIIRKFFITALKSSN